MIPFKWRKVLRFRGISRTLSSEDCPSSKRDGILTIDCRSCSGKQDLLDPDCLKSVLLVLSSDMGVKEIRLCGEWEINYSGACVEALCRLATVFAFCTDLTVSSDASPRCEGCELSSRLLYGPLAYQLQSLPDASRLASMIPRPTRLPKECGNCFKRASSNLAQIRCSLDELNGDMCRETSRFVEDSDEA